MYVHIGGEVSVLAQSITSIINFENILPTQKDITEFLRTEEDNNRLQYLTEDIPRAIVVTRDRTYISPISPAVLKKRIEKGVLT
ncbi:MAG: DUF370 domain-containing protein [Saccharofermentans sp.]|nr:DUF370 domain-containing protein [Saccharofermentans sp.]